MKEYLILAGETIVQTVRDYPKGYLILLGVVAVLGIVF